MSKALYNSQHRFLHKWWSLNPGCDIWQSIKIRVQLYMGVSLNGGTPKTPPKWSFFSRKTGKPHGFVGYHHFRKPPYDDIHPGVSLSLFLMDSRNLVFENQGTVDTSHLKQSKSRFYRCCSFLKTDVCGFCLTPKIMKPKSNPIW